jgi:hypothetical protein
MQFGTTWLSSEWIKLEIISRDVMAPVAIGVSRKNKRKQERQDKKQRKNKQPRVERETTTQNASKSVPEKPQHHARSTNTSRKRVPSSANRSGFQNKFHELVQETTGRSMHGEREELSREDAQIHALERNLGLGAKKDGLKRLQKCVNGRKLQAHGGGGANRVCGWQGVREGRSGGGFHGFSIEFGQYLVVRRWV